MYIYIYIYIYLSLYIYIYMALLGPLARPEALHGLADRGDVPGLRGLEHNNNYYYIYICIHTCVYIHIYREREIDICINSSESN